MPPWELVKSVVDSELRNGLQRGTGLKAGLFRNSDTKDLAIFFAGTEVKNKDFITFVKERFPWETWGDKVKTVGQGYALCLWHSQTCTQISYVLVDIMTGQPLDVWLSALSRVDANVLLKEPALADNIYAVIGFALAGEADINSDINIAYPVMSPRAKSMFDLAGRLYDDWGKSDEFTDLLGPPSSRRIVMVGGHSLGGSIAQVVGLSRNVPVITFNSAPIPLDPKYRSEISYDANRNNILNVRSSNDLLTGIVRSVQSNDRLRSFLTTLIEGVYKQRKCPDENDCLNENLKSRFETVINDNNFYAGKGNWLVNDAQTGHEIQPLAENMKNTNNCSAHTSGTVPLGINPTVAKDNNAKQVAPKTVSKVKKVTRAGCNKSSSVLSPSTGGAERELKKYGTGTDGCTQ